MFRLPMMITLSSFFEGGFLLISMFRIKLIVFQFPSLFLLGRVGGSM